VERELNRHVNDLDILIKLSKVYTDILGANSVSFSSFNGLLGSLEELAKIDNKTGFLNTSEDEPSFWEPDVYIKGKRAKCLIDSGASCSVLSSKFLENCLSGLIGNCIKPSSRVILLADQSKTMGKGEVKLPIHVEGKESLVNMLILDELGYDLILGRDWCMANAVILDFEGKSLAFGNNFIYQIEDKPINFCVIENLIKLESEVKLSPFCETKVQITSNGISDGLYYAKNYVPLVEKFGVFICKGVLEFKNGYSFVMMANLITILLTHI